MVFSMLYAKASNDKIKMWSITAEGNTMIIRNGYEGGKMAEQRKTITGKNIGKANETSDAQQCHLECKSKWQKKLDEQYCQDRMKIKEYGEQEVLLPMLALNFRDREHDIKFPCYVQPKLNGCLFRTSKIETLEGIRTIEEIVENKINTKVRSFNEITQQIEWKNISNWMKKGKIVYKNWRVISPNYGKPLKVTEDHKIFTSNGWKAAKELNPIKDRILVTASEDRLNSLLAGTILGDSSLVLEKRGSGKAYRLIFQHTNKEYFNFKVGLFGLKGRVINIVTGYGSKGWKFISTALTSAGTIGGFPIKKFYWVGHSKMCGKRKLLPYRTLKNILTLESLALWISDDGSLRLNNRDQTTPVLSLATQGFSKEQINIFKLWFKRKLFCNPTSISFKRKDGSLGYGLDFNTKDTLYILNKLRKLNCKGVEYKFYFTTEAYLENIKEEKKFTTFKVSHSRNMPPAEKYDIEVEDNHNFFANGILVHNCRCVYQGGKFISRKGKEYTTLKHLTAELKALGINTPDGEIYVHGMAFQEIIRRVKKDRGVKTQALEYWIYDQINKDIFSKRIEGLITAFGNTSSIKVKYVETILAKSKEEIKYWHDKFVQQGFEGVIIRNVNGLYKVKHRSQDLQKYKEFFDAEFEIVGYHEGTGTDNGTVIFEVRTKKGQVFSVRPRGTHEVRSEYLKDIGSIIGKELTVRYQNLSESGIPVFPVGICIRDYE